MMLKVRYSLLLVVALLVSLVAEARSTEGGLGTDTVNTDRESAAKRAALVQSIRDIAIYYEHDRAWPRWDYSSNKKTYDILVDVVYQLSRQQNTRAMVIEGAASPIGSERYNHNLAMRRAQILRDIIVRMKGGGNLRIEVVSTGEDWDTFYHYVYQNYKKPNREAVLQILRKDISHDEKEMELKHLDRHKTWRLLVKEFMASARNAAVIRFVEIKDLNPKKPKFEPMRPLVLGEIGDIPIKMQPILPQLKWPARLVSLADLRKPDFYLHEVDVFGDEKLNLISVTPVAESDLGGPYICTKKQEVTGSIALGVDPIAQTSLGGPSIFAKTQDLTSDLDLFSVAPFAESSLGGPSIFAKEQDVTSDLNIFSVAPFAESSLGGPKIFAKTQDLTSDLTNSVDLVTAGDMAFAPIYVAGGGVIYESNDDLAGKISLLGESELLPPQHRIVTRVLRKPVVAVRTNLLVPALNIGVEVPIKTNWSVGADYYFPWVWPKKDNKNCFELLSWGVEGRYWFGKNRTVFNRLQGHSVGVYGYMGYFDFERNFKGHQGEFVNFGIDYTYAMAVGKKKAIHFEFSIGLGYIHSQARRYTVIESAGPLIDNKITRKINYFGPTKANVSLVVPIFKKVVVKDIE